MPEPNIAQKAPYALELEAGDYHWCACGKSSNQPFCNGSHKGSEFVPMAFTLDEKKKVWLCGCKNTKNAPFCDGTHKGL
jgi:CDGSH iron-sulfur domain-containing protein 3